MFNYKLNYKNSVDLERRKKFSESILKRHDFVPVVIDSFDYDISNYIGTLNRKWINKEYYKKTELQYVLLDILKNVFINNITLNETEYLTFQIDSTIFPVNTTLEEIYSIYKDKEDNILYLMLIKTNGSIFSKFLNWFKIVEYKIYKIRDSFLKKQEKIQFESPYHEIL